MNAIDNIISEINRQAEEERHALEKNRLEEIDTHFLVEKRASEEEHQQLTERQKNQIERKFQQEKNRVAMKARQEKLKQKQVYLEQIFEEAYLQMTKWSQEEAQLFALKALKQSKLTRGEFIPSEALKATFTADWLQKVNQTLAATFTLANPINSREYGFLVEQEGIRYNYFYRELLVELKKEHGNDIMRALFDKEG
ncbi:hypothetical protein IV487_12225 [Enterococcus saccharolyticus]|uniref:Uncharacterized protein n=1 Tax=Candidatus Enterococcus willemsii TaxID=1857215 RepID=A0ABQ6Z2M1_9ENTE|nr:MULTISPECIES: hypothetical protein [Enterococcus]KAF1306019.1 hypothetical protein BAU17_03375 [Enterococcus sp. CU12B]MCD5003230.1 hypothetical protein [Enterococcus saccharolyticus]